MWNHHRILFSYHLVDGSYFSSFIVVFFKLVRSLFNFEGQCTVIECFTEYMPNICAYISFFVVVGNWFEKENGSLKTEF